MLHTRRFRIFKRCVFTFPICLFTLSVYLKKFFPIVARWNGMEMLNFSYQYRINPLIGMEIRGVYLVCRVVRTGSLKKFGRAHTLFVKPPTSSLVSTIIKSCTERRSPFFFGREESASRKNVPRFRWIPAVTRHEKEQRRCLRDARRRNNVSTIRSRSYERFYGHFSSGCFIDRDFRDTVRFPGRGDEMNFHLFFISYRLVFQFRAGRVQRDKWISGYRYYFSIPSAEIHFADFPPPFFFFFFFFKYSLALFNIRVLPSKLQKTTASSSYLPSQWILIFPSLLIV